MQRWCAAPSPTDNICADRPAGSTPATDVGHNRLVIVDCAVYQDGQRKEIEPEQLEDEINHARQHPDEFVWIGLYEPSPAELQRVAAEFDLHPLAVEDALEAHQRPKLDVYGESLFLVLKTLAPGALTWRSARSWSSLARLSSSP